MASFSSSPLCNQPINCGQTPSSPFTVFFGIISSRRSACEDSYRIGIRLCPTCSGMFENIKMSTSTSFIIHHHHQTHYHSSLSSTTTLLIEHSKGVWTQSRYAYPSYNPNACLLVNSRNGMSFTSLVTMIGKGGLRLCLP